MSAAADEVRRAETIRRSAGLAFVTQIVSAMLTAALTFFLVRALSVPSYGAFALALSVGTLVQVPSDFGVTQATARFLAERSGDLAACARVLGEGVRLKLMLSVPACTVLAALAEPIADAYAVPGLAWPLRGIALAVLLQNLMLLFTGAFVALRRVSLQLLVYGLESTAELGLSIALVLLGAGATGAAFGRGAGYLCGTAVAAAVAFRMFGTSWFGHERFGLRQLASYAGTMFIVDGAFTLFYQVDVLLLGAYLGASSAALFAAPLRITALLAYPGLASSVAIAPRAAGAPREQTFTALERGLRLLLLVQALEVPFALVWATPITSLVLGSGYGGSAAVMRTLTPYIFLAGLAPLVSLPLNYIGEARLRVPIALATVAINVVLDVILIPKIGVIAGAVSSDVAYILYVSAHFVICARKFQLKLGRLAMTFVRGMLAAAAAAGALAAFGTASHLSPLSWSGGALAAGAAFAAVLVATREVSIGELGSVRRLVRR